MFSKIFYCEYERIKDNKVVGKSFRVFTIKYWESISKPLESQILEIEQKFQCSAYLKKIKRID